MCQILVQNLILDQGIDEIEFCLMYSTTASRTNYMLYQVLYGIPKKTQNKKTNEF